MTASTRTPVVLLHGFLGCAEDWEATAQRLRASGRTVWCPTLPGHAGVPLVEPVTMDAWADDLVAHAPDGRVDWAGYSMGGRLALHVASRHPSRVGRLALVSASLGLEGAEVRRARRVLDAERAAALQADFEAWLSAWYRQPLFAPLGDSPEALAQEVARRVANDPVAMARVIVGLSPGAAPAHASWWARWAGPTTWVAGALDLRYADAAVRNASGHPAAEARIIAGAGHAVLRTAASAVASEVLRAFDRPVLPVEQPPHVDE